jgi:hypothetical protein
MFAQKLAEQRTWTAYRDLKAGASKASRSTWFFIWLGSFGFNCFLILDHGAKLLTEFWSVLVPVNRACVQHRQFQNFVLCARNGN